MKGEVLDLDTEEGREIAIVVGGHREINPKDRQQHHHREHSKLQHN